ncbi:MAG TPA: hypothetical protein VMV57_06845 [Terracidiphilus sp.]|nr:hypothetical protein [Terracidiphilus sp.]
MSKHATQSPSLHLMNLLSRLLLLPHLAECDTSEVARLKLEVQQIRSAQFDELVGLASSNHVIVRGLEAFLKLTNEAEDGMRIEWAQTALATERMRISTALSFLQRICSQFESQNFDIAVIKSLDHWPDLGSDLDLYTNADSSDVLELMKKCFDAKVGPRSWGDRLARKWNFYIPGLPEAVEIHMGRLGQTGEQVAIAAHLPERTRQIVLDGETFRVPSASDRLMISTLQRMYRHFYFRLCDIVDTAALSEAGDIDYIDLRSSAIASGIWEGVATYLVIVSDYVRTYRGAGLVLPQLVNVAARFGGDDVFYAREFLRVPIMPQSARLYGSQLLGLLRKQELMNSARLSLLPCLATAALVGQKLTGSDKGIW